MFPLPVLPKPMFPLPVLPKPTLLLPTFPRPKLLPPGFRLPKFKMPRLAAPICPTPEFARPKLRFASTPLELVIAAVTTAAGAAANWAGRSVRFCGGAVNGVRADATADAPAW